ncbi:aminotransferase class I/II-fold pyridoxal phosphate-dependent enzyme [Cutibacterium avidum]|uniref:pyridoxal phosphate-dependent aminotransferase n=1 Tax=Cutibacterium avidum TaxID=33010 RepID=UPI00192C3AEE|nr:aminotransferase class I/II-fold pyridoxal phosphate-dependent enzyme [Cutibacterium avidum]QQY15469.1 aminotransferase class I/II-fold pyridoxal phosphate-dependent enzyme [Cutibacterium avidum]
MIAWELAERLAHVEAVPVECVLVGAGSAALLHSMFQALIHPGERVVYPWPSFESYPVVATLGGAVPNPIPLLRNAAQDLETMVDASFGAKAVILCEPNNPTGLDMGAPRLIQALKAMDQNAILFIDQAYIEFQDSGRRASVYELLSSHPHVVVLRTFSKAYGLAGLRVGMAYVSPELAQPFHKTLMPCGVKSLASVAALWSLENKSVMQDRVSAVVGERNRMRQNLKAIGIMTLRSQTNFILAQISQPSTIATQLRDEGVLVRTVDELGLRVTVGSHGSNDRFISSLARLVA